MCVSQTTVRGMSIMPVEGHILNIPIKHKAIKVE